MAKTQHKGTGLALHATTAAFTPARAVTSHLRKRYREKYLGRFRFAPFVFIFDLSMLGLAATLVGLNVYLFMVLPPHIEDYHLQLLTPPIRTAVPLALEARVISMASSSRERVRLMWDLPPGTEILQSDPPLSDEREAFLGKIEPGKSVSSRLVVRLFRSPGSVRFGFKLSDDRGSVTGAETRRIDGSGLVFKPLFDVSAIPKDGEIAYLLQNQTNMILDAVNVRAVSGGSFEEGRSITVGSMQPYSERVFIFKPDAASAILYEASAQNTVLVQTQDPIALLESDPTQVRLTLQPSSGSEARLIVQASRTADINVFHPGIADEGHLKTFVVPEGRTELRIPVSASVDPGSWYAIPSAQWPDGVRGGYLSRGSITTPFMISTSARYYASNGDQIGIGPLPPVVGEATKYWVQLKLAPTSADISNLRVVARLGRNVRVTGRDALPDGGTFVETDEGFVWSTEYLAANALGATASFEIELLPDAGQKGSVPVLIESVIAEAQDVRSDIKLESRATGVNANLPDDELGKNRGTVK